jgi:hypothetical protein
MPAIRRVADIGRECWLLGVMISIALPGTVSRRAHASELDLLGKGKGVLDLDAEILDGAFDLGMPKQ